MSEFDNCAPLTGLEYLGRHIRDANGAPSGSPANFETLRGIVDPSARIPTAQDIAASEALIMELFTSASLSVSAGVAVLPSAN